MEFNKNSIVEEGVKNVVIMFKKQREGTLDLWLLKHSVRQWYKFYKNKEIILICGSYSQAEQDEIIDYLGKDFLRKHKAIILNIGEIPPAYNRHKADKLNYQLIAAWAMLKQGFILAYNDLFPIKLIDDTYLNKEYKILYPDYRKLPTSKLYWWTEFYIRTAETFREKFGVEHYTLYKGHTLQYYSPEFMEFYLDNPEFHFDMNRNVVLLYWNLMKGYNVLREDFTLNTFFNNKWIVNKNKIKSARMFDVTLPEHPKTKALLKKLLSK